MTAAALAGTAALVGASGMACDDPEPYVAVRLTDHRAIEILLNFCHDDRPVSSVALMAPDDVPLWRVEFGDPSSLRRFVVGEEPAGATTTVALTETLGGTRFLVEVNGFSNDYFSFRELRTDEVLVVRRGYMSEDEFWARDTCN